MCTRKHLLVLQENIIIMFVYVTNKDLELELELEIESCRIVLCGASDITLTLQVLVLPFDCLQVVERLLVAILELKKLRAETARLLLGGVQLGVRLLVLLPPLQQHLDQLTQSSVAMLRQGKFSTANTH